jgi:hypothetical protein
MNFSSTKLVLLAAISAISLSATAAPRAAKSYSCTAFNALTGYARITYGKRASERVASARITYGWLVNEVQGGVLVYEPEVTLNFPKAILEVKVNGVVVPVHMDLLRPLEHKSKEVILAGLTYVPSFALAPNLAAFAPFSGTLSHLSYLVPVPVGFTPTSVVTCRVQFQ